MLDPDPGQQLRWCTFVGWEGVGFCSSYLLIGFYFRKEEFPPRTPANKAFIVNRIGDLAFVLGCYLIWSPTFGTLNYTEIFPRIQHRRRRVGIPEAGDLPDQGPSASSACCMFIGATGKSAQLPLLSSGSPTRWKARPRSRR